jgi:hypothetical protein
LQSQKAVSEAKARRNRQLNHNKHHRHRQFVVVGAAEPSFRIFRKTQQQELASVAPEEVMQLVEEMHGLGNHKGMHCFVVILFSSF